STHVLPDFNVADCCLVCGAGVLLVHSFFVTDPATQKAPAVPVAVEMPAPMHATTTTSGV
ncbi:MAG: signal peptidase II, partial [Planctomycetes bacterium]|nr:signal peptidase II [Planctomycetota bacterium]